MRRKWKVGAAIAALAVAAMTSSAVLPAVADDTVWWSQVSQTYDVPIDISSATEGIPAEYVERVVVYNAWCYTPGASPATWTGSSARVTVGLANTDAVSCTVDVRVEYCGWQFILFTCDYSVYRSYSGTGGPAHVDPYRPTVLGVSPIGTLANAQGWYRSPGLVEWYGHDAESGIRDCTRNRIDGPDTASRTLEGVCADLAGNVSAVTRFTYKYDATPPTLAPSVPSPLAIGSVAHADPGASDATSGVAAQSCNNGAALDTSTAGIHTAACTARDVAGNTASATVSYTVGYGFGGFEDPVSDGELNSIKAGRSVPLTFHVTSDAAGTPVLDLDASKVKVTATGIACDLGETPNLLEESAAGASGLQNLGEGTYRFVWTSPKSYAGSCKLLQVDLGDGNPHSVEFAFAR